MKKNPKLIVLIHRPSLVSQAIASVKERMDERQGKIKELLNSTGDVLGEAGKKAGKAAEKFVVSFNDTRYKASEMLKDVLGKDFKDYFPASWDSPDMSWMKLGDFDFEKTFAEFTNASSLKDLVKPQSLGDLYLNFGAVVASYCSNDT